MASASATICIAPLSSPYSLLPRAHTYALVVALLAPLPRGWLFRAALAAFTARTAIFTVDSIRLYATTHKHPHGPAHLDILVATESLAMASLVAVWLLVVSRRGAESAARGLVRGWAVAVGIGAIVGFAALRELSQVESEGDCNEVVMDVVDVFGDSKKFGAGLGTMGEKIGYFVLRVGIVGVLFAAMAFIASVVSGPKDKSESGLPVAVVRRRREQEARYSSGPINPEDDTAIAAGRVTKIARRVLLVVIPAMLIFVAVSGEWYFQKLAPDVPSVEKMSSVGQWGVWAATGVVVIATAVNAAMDAAGMRMHAEPSDHSPPKDDEVIKF